MTGVGGPTGPGSIGEAPGAGGVDAADGPEGADATDGIGGADRIDAAEHTAASHGASGIDGRLADLTADLASGRITPEQLVDRLIGDQASIAGLSADDRADLVEVMNDLVAHDPHLQGLVGALR